MVHNPELRKALAPIVSGKGEFKFIGQSRNMTLKTKGTDIFVSFTS